MKKILIVLLLALTCASTRAASISFTVNHIKYTTLSTTDNTVRVDGIDDKTITDLTIPGTVEYNGTNYQVTTIKSGAFGSSLALKNVVLSEGITTIESNAFGICRSLETISLPKTLTIFNTSGLSAFRECYNLKSIKVAEGNPALKVDECGVLYDYDMKNLIYCPPAIDMSRVKANYIVPSTVENICSYAFNYMPFKHIVLPSKLQTIGESAFLQSDDISTGKELTIPASVTKIGSSAFYNSGIGTIFFLWDGNTSLPTPDTNIKDITIYVKKSVYDNHLAELQSWVSTTYAYKIPIKPTKTYSTMCRDFDVDLSNTETTTGVQAFYATSVGNGKVVLKETNYVPSRNGTNLDEYTGVIIKVANPNTTYYYQIGEKDYTSSNQSPSLNGNLLVGVPAETYIYGKPEGYVGYGLYDGEFRQYSNDGFLAYNKAYLRLPASAASAKTLAISTDETPTGISEVSDSKKAEAPYYTLSGTRLSSEPTHPGIYIHGGKKVVWAK